MDDITMGDDQPIEASSRRNVGPRLYHKKSRMGCLRCKQRRVKCDEGRPACGGCSRHQVECVYPTPSAQHRGSNNGGSGSNSHNTVRIARAESSSGHSHDGLSPNPLVLPSSERSGFTPGPEPSSSYLSLLDSSSGFSPTATAPTPSPYSHHPSPPNINFNSMPPPPSSTRAPSIASNSSSSRSGTIEREAQDYLAQLVDPDSLDIPESRERRIWELRLMHNFMLNQAQQFLGPSGRHKPQPTPSILLRDDEVDNITGTSPFPAGAFLWGRELLHMAFEDDAILYGMLASSALNMWTKSIDPKEKDELRLFQQKYLSMALREQRHAVGNLSRENADNVCISSLALLQNSFALVQTLPITPWQPPLEWLRMGKGAGAVLTVARGFLGYGGDDKITRFVNSQPRMDPDEMFTAENRAHLVWVLENDGGRVDAVGDHELQDKVTLGIYNRVLSYVGSVQRAISEGREPLYAIIRRFIGFAVWMPEVYHDFLTQMRPRALIALAHFFAMWIPYDDLWLIGKTGENQVRGIYETLPLQWRHKLDPIFEQHKLRESE